MRESDDSMISGETEKDQERVDDSPKSHKPINKKLIAVLVIIAAAAVVIVAGFAIHSKNNSDTENNTEISVSSEEEPEISAEEETEVSAEPEAAEEPEIEEETVSEDEYIFPHSDTEYLTDADLENLTAEELALARNEIIARHGRIFTTDTYKEYFESKSWYEGTTDPETFDANYDNELNEIEKANVALIQTYEAKLDQEAQSYIKSMATEYYDGVLACYQSEESDGFTGDPPEINPIFYSTDYFPNGFDASGIELYYTIIDLAGDGVPELFIADQNGAIYDSFCIMEGEGQILPLIYLWDFPGDVVYICEDNVLKRVSNNSFGYYRVDAHAEYAECTDAIMQNGNSYYYGYYDDASGEFITSSSATASDYQEMTSKYIVRSDITWLKISEYEYE